MQLTTLEFEVFHPDLAAWMEMPKYATRAHAESARAALNEKLPGFEVREIEQGREPIPTRAPVPTPVTVHEVRQLLARHGQDVVALVAWTQNGSVNIATAGSSSEQAQVAYELGQRIASGLGLLQADTTPTVLEDRRGEHATDSNDSTNKTGAVS